MLPQRGNKQGAFLLPQLPAVLHSRVVTESSFHCSDFEWMQKKGVSRAICIIATGHMSGEGDKSPNSSLFLDAADLCKPASRREKFLGDFGCKIGATDLWAESSHHLCCCFRLLLLLLLLLIWRGESGQIGRPGFGAVIVVVVVVDGVVVLRQHSSLDGRISL